MDGIVWVFDPVIDYEQFPFSAESVVRVKKDHWFAPLSSPPFPPPPFHSWRGPPRRTNIILLFHSLFFLIRARDFAEKEGMLVV